MTYWIVVISASLLAFVIWGYVFHELGWRKGATAGYDKGMREGLAVGHDKCRQEGYAEGHDRGVKEGFEAGKSYIDNWWIRTENEIDQTRKGIRKEGWP